MIMYQRLPSHSFTIAEIHASRGSRFERLALVAGSRVASMVFEDLARAMPTSALGMALGGHSCEAVEVTVVCCVLDEDMVFAFFGGPMFPLEFAI